MRKRRFARLAAIAALLFGLAGVASAISFNPATNGHMPDKQWVAADSNVLNISIDQQTSPGDQANYTVDAAGTTEKQPPVRGKTAVAANEKTVMNSPSAAITPLADSGGVGTCQGTVGGHQAATA